MNAEISGGVKVLLTQLDAQHLAGRKIIGQAKREELQFVLDILDAASHQSLHAVDGVIGGLDQIFSRGVANNDLAALVEGDDGWHEDWRRPRPG